jgi:hypothetical protein
MPVFYKHVRRCSVTEDFSLNASKARYITYLNCHPGDCYVMACMYRIKMSLAICGVVTSAWWGNFMLNWAINRRVTGKTSNHRFQPVDTGLIDIANTTDIESLVYTQNGM